MICEKKKTAKKKTNIGSWKSVIFQKLESMQRLQLLQNGQFASKIKNAKNMQKTILKEH